ncbi:hypothetical protein MASR2M117_19380 [Paludibacter sp.]
MNRFIHYISIIILAISHYLQAQNSDKITRVLEYKPAPGQHINRLFPTPSMSNTYNDALQFANNTLINNKSYLGLGAYGGYVVVGFDHSIINIAGEYDFKVLGNASFNGAEPGIVMVCQDLNKNGLPDPDEPWFELAGSEYSKAETIKNYEISYYRPTPDKQKSNIAWTDNQGNSGVITHISFASQATMYPLWIDSDTLTFRGTKLKNNVTGGGSNWQLPAYDWGYADNQANNSAIDKIGFKIDWAVDINGNSVHLDYIDFIKIYTAVSQEAGWLGETSTEVAGVVDLHPQETDNRSSTTEQVYKAIKAYRSGNIIYNLPIGGKIKIYSISGTIYKQCEIETTKMEIPKDEMFIIWISTDEGYKIIR